MKIDLSDFDIAETYPKVDPVTDSVRAAITEANQKHNVPEFGVVEFVRTVQRAMENQEELTRLRIWLKDVFYLAAEKEKVRQKNEADQFALRVGRGTIAMPLYAPLVLMNAEWLERAANILVSDNAGIDLLEAIQRVNVRVESIIVNGSGTFMRNGKMSESDRDIGVETTLMTVALMLSVLSRKVKE